jgi:hypothetical protein
MQFLNPIWLFAMEAVVIPVAIHLWNIRPGKVLKVGSISLMDAASRKNSRSFKLLDIPLFILRCLLLILLALLLAMPLWHKKLETIKAKGWIIVPKENFQIAYSKFKSRIDSLNNAGYELHFFNTGFSKTDLKQILLNPKDSLQTANIKAADYWNLTRQLDTTVSSTLPIYIFTPNRANYFTGQKPRVALNLHWQTYLPADSAATWIEGAWFNNNNTIRVVQGNSKPTGTIYTYTNIQTGNLPNSPYNVTVNNGLAIVSLKTGNHQPVKLDTSALRIAVYADNNNADANYLKAALQAVSQFMQRKTVIKQYKNPKTIPANQTWLFWLSEKPLYAQLLQGAQNILTYEKGRVVSSNSWLNNNGSFSVAFQQQQKIGLFKMVEANGAANQTTWRDGFGHPVLSLQNQTKNNIYHFYSRFNPTWNDLVWSNEFPTWIMKLVVGNKTASLNKNDRRILDQQQLMPVNESRTHEVAVKTIGTINIVNYCWLLLAFLFLAERWLANRTQNTTSNG